MEEGGAPKKRHSPHPDDVNFDKAGLLDEIKEKPSGCRVCIYNVIYIF